jgi:hypothetical protein
MIMMNVLHVVKRWTTANAMFVVIATRIRVNAVRLLNLALVVAGMMWPTVIATKHLTGNQTKNVQLARAREV